MCIRDRRRPTILVSDIPVTGFKYVTVDPNEYPEIEADVYCPNALEHVEIINSTMAIAFIFLLSFVKLWHSATYFCKLWESAFAKNRFKNMQSFFHVQSTYKDYCLNHIDS